MRKFILCGLATLMMITITGVTYTNGDEKESFELNIGNGEIITTIEGEEFFIPVATGNHIIWGQKDGKATNLMSCDINTGETQQINRGSFSHIYDTYPGEMVSVSNGWVTFLKSSIVSDGDVWVCRADGTVPLKSVTTENCTKTSYPIFHGDNLYFWQNCINDEPSGIYRYNTKADETVLLYETEKSASGLFKIRVTDDYILLIDFSYSGNATLLDSTGKLIKILDYSDDDITDNNIKKATFYDIFSDTILFDRYEATIDENKKSVVSLNSFFIYDISDDEVIELGPTSEIGSTANCVRISPEIFSFIHAKEIRDLNPETREYDFTMNILSADTSIKNMMYNAPITQKYETRSNHYSSIWKNYIVYPGGDDPNNWYVNLYDAKNKTEYRITDKKGEYHYPTINEGVVSYFSERPTGDGYDLVVHRIEELEPAGEQGNVNRELEFEDGVIYVDPQNSIEQFKVADNYIIWIESDNTKSYLKSYSFETGATTILIDDLQKTKHCIHPTIMLSDNYFAIEEKLRDMVGSIVSVGKLDGTDLTRIENNYALNISLLAMEDGKVYVYEEDFSNEKNNGIYEYDIVTNETEYLFNPTYAISTLRIADGKFVVANNKIQNIHIYSRNGNIIRTLAKGNDPDKTDFYPIISNIVEMTIDEYIIFQTSVFESTGKRSFERFCYNVNTGGLWQIPFSILPRTSINNPDIFLTKEYRRSGETKPPESQLSSTNPRTRKTTAINSFERHTKKYFIGRDTSPTVYESLVGFFEYISMDAEDSSFMKNIIFFDTISEKEYQVTETPGDYSDLYLSRDRITYQEDNKIISHKFSVVEDSQ